MGYDNKLQSHAQRVRLGCMDAVEDDLGAGHLAAGDPGAGHPAAGSAAQDVATVADVPAPAAAPSSAGRRMAGPRDLQRAQAYVARVLDAQQEVVSALRGNGSTADIGQAQALYALAAQQLQSALAGIPAAGAPVAGLPAPPETAADLPKKMFSPGVRSSESDAAFWERIGAGIGSLKKDYLGVYETAVQKNNAFFKDFGAIVTKIGSWSTSSGDNIILEIGKGNGTGTGLLDALEVFELKYRDGPSTLFVADQAATEAENKAIAEKWARDMGFPSSVVIPNSNNPVAWLVKLDFDPIFNMIAALKAFKEEKPTLNSARYQAWKTGFSAQEDRLKNTASTLAQKLSNAQSIFENMVKVLSSTIAAMLETDKSFLQN